MLYARTKIDTFCLDVGSSHCEVLPRLGGAIGAWTVAGQPLLRAASAKSIAGADPYGTASFPLVPYSNRIGNGQFRWQGRSISVARNFFPEPHAIHGVGFEHPWDVVSATSESIVLRFVNRPGTGWPWPFEAQQRIALLGENVMSIALRATNLAADAVPLAFGHHPYFPRAGASLRFAAQSVWLSDDDGLPTLQVKPFDKFDYSQLRPVTQGDIDHCFSRWDGAARIEWQGQPLALDIHATPNLPCAVVCIRSDVDGFCFEPVPHINNALNRPEPGCAMPVVQPGESFEATITFTCGAARPSPGAPA